MTLPVRIAQPVAVSPPLPFNESEVPPSVGGVLVVDLDTIVENFQKIAQFLPHAKSGAVVKANAYGVGLVPISKALVQVGCQDFFVATVDEGAKLREALSISNIYVLNGVLPRTEALLTQHNLIPVLNDLQQIERWQRWIRQKEKQFPAVLHVDTGIWRTGLPPQEFEILVQQPERLDGVHLCLIMSHLACGELQTHPLNAQQLEAFQRVRQRFPTLPASLANSGGILLGSDYQCDLVRPGKSLLGVGTVIAPALGLRSSVHIYAQVLQVRDIPAGHSVGYDARYQSKTTTRLATLMMGYADGILRAFTNKGVVYIAGIAAPIVGRVSMDLVTVDATHVPEEFIYPGAWAEVVGEHISADDQAAAGGTISREIYTNLGERYHRIYKGEKIAL